MIMNKIFGEGLVRGKIFREKIFGKRIFRRISNDEIATLTKPEVQSRRSSP